MISILRSVNFHNAMRNMIKTVIKTVIHSIRVKFIGKLYTKL